MPRGGPRPNSGGARPGAGRPASPILDYRRRMQEELRAAVTVDDVRAIAATAVAQAKQGDDRARQWLAPFVLGKPPEELHLRHGNLDGEPVRFTIRIGEPAELGDDEPEPERERT